LSRVGSQRDGNHQRKGGLLLESQKPLLHAMMDWNGDLGDETMALPRQKRSAIDTPEPESEQDHKESSGDG